MLDQDAYVHLCTLSGRDQRKLEQTFNLLRDHPFAEPSFVEHDSEGEAVCHLFLERYSIAYHVDHAVRLVLILQIHQNS